MDLNLLRTFRAVSDTGHLTRAAERVHLSQPAVSAHVKALEEEFGVQLFERRHSGMELTRAGARLLQIAERVLAAADELRTAAGELRGERVGRVRIGTLLSADFIRVGELLARMLERFPLIALEIQHELSGEVVEALRAGTLDAGFFLGGVLEPGTAGRQLTELRYRVAIPKVLAAKFAHARWKSLADAPWIATPRHGAHRRMISSLFEQRRLAFPVRVVEADDEDAITHLAISGVGLALMRDEVARREAERGRIVIREDVEIRTALWFIYLAERAADSVLQSLVEVLASVWPPDMSRPRTRPS